MSKYNDESPDIKLWTNRKLVSEMDEYVKQSRTQITPILSNNVAKAVMAEIRRRFVRSSSKGE